MRTLCLSLLCLSVWASAAPAAYTIGADARPRVGSGKIVTDAFDDPSGTLIPDVRYFGYEFQTNLDDPYFTQDPGFNAVAGSGLPPGSTLGFNVVRHLAYWDGSGAVSFTTPANAESLQYSFGLSSVVVTGATSFVPGFVFGTVSSTGAVHRHLNAVLRGADVNTNPTDGIYFTNLRLVNSGGVNPSDSLYMVYNNGASTAQFTAALDYLSNPLPGDANFDGVVDLDDFNILATNFNQSDRFWYEGDFTGDYQVNLDDFNVLAGNFNQGAASLALVPEPTLLSTLLFGAALLRRRRR